MNNDNCGIVLTRDLYKQFKSFDREKMQAVLIKVYLEGVNSAETSNIDLDELRTVIGSVKGIGQKRLNEIMAAIGEYMDNKDQKENE